MAPLSSQSVLLAKRSQTSMERHKDLAGLKRKLQPLLKSNDTSQYAKDVNPKHLNISRLIDSIKSPKKLNSSSNLVFSKEVTHDISSSDEFHYSNLSNDSLVSPSKISKNYSNGIINHTVFPSPTISSPDIPKNGGISGKVNDSSFEEADDLYICTDCQPKQILDGEELGSHFITYPTHFNTNPLSDYKGFKDPKSDTKDASLTVNAKRVPENESNIYIEHSTNGLEINIKRGENCDTINTAHNQITYLKIIPLHKLM